MIAAISPAISNASESLGTLRFAETCKAVKTRALKNEEIHGNLLEELRAERDALRDQLANSAADSKMSEKVLAYEALIAKYGADIESRIKSSQELEKARSHHLEDSGLGFHDISFSSSTPQLHNIHEDPSLTGCLVYNLPQGEGVTLGCGTSCSIVLKGLGMLEQMASIINIDNVKVTLTRDAGRILLNGNPLQQAATQTMHHFDRIIVGHAYCFRLLIPEAKGEVEEILKKEAYLLEQALAEIVPENSEAHEHCSHYISELRDRVGDEQTQNFLLQFRVAAPLVEEANMITQEVRPSDQFRFSIEVMSDFFHV
jgi:hypothetical protein